VLADTYVDDKKRKKLLRHAKNKNLKKMLFSLKVSDHLKAELFVQNGHGSNFRKPQTNNYCSKNKLFQSNVSSNTNDKPQANSTDSFILKKLLSSQPISLGRIVPEILKKSIKQTAHCSSSTLLPNT